MKNAPLKNLLILKTIYFILFFFLWDRKSFSPKDLTSVAVWKQVMIFALQLSYIFHYYILASFPQDLYAEACLCHTNGFMKQGENKTSLGAYACNRLDISLKRQLSPSQVTSGDISS